MTKQKNKDTAKSYVPTEADNKVALLKKLHKVMEQVGTLQKDSKNTHQGYEYLSESNVKQNLQPLLVDNGIYFYVEVQDTRSKGIYETSSGNTMYLTKVPVRYHFVDVETGNEITGVFEGHGTDTGDKGIYKGITGAIKYILTSNFLIPTGDDPEVDTKKENRPSPGRKQKQKTSKKKPKKTATDKQVKYLSVLLSKLGDKQEDVEKKIKDKYGVESKKDLGRNEISDAIQFTQKSIVVNYLKGSEYYEKTALETKDILEALEYEFDDDDWNPVIDNLEGFPEKESETMLRQIEDYHKADKLRESGKEDL